MAVVASMLAAGGGVATPGHAVTTVDHGEWYNAKSTHNCTGGTTTFICRHTATMDPFSPQVTSGCLEVEPRSGQPVRTGCSAELLKEGDLTYVRSSGAGKRGACSTTRTTDGTVPEVSIFSRVLSREFDVPVDIINTPTGSTISGTRSTSDGLTIHVEGKWTNGCSDPTVEGATVGTWSGSFDIVI